MTGTSDLGPSMETLQDLVVAFSAQRDTLLDKLRDKLDELKEVCMQESVSSFFEFLSFVALAEWEVTIGPWQGRISGI